MKEKKGIYYIIDEVLYRYKDGQHNLESKSTRSKIADEIATVILDRINEDALADGELRFSSDVSSKKYVDSLMEEYLSGVGKVMDYATSKISAASVGVREVE